MGDEEDRIGVVLAFDQPAVRHAARRRRTMLVATAASVIAVLALAVGWVRSGTDDVLIDAAVGVEVLFPDGSIVTGAEGLVLPPGAVVDVGGSMTIDGRGFGPGRYRVAADGSIVLVVSTTTTESSDVTVSATTTIVGESVNNSAPSRPAVTITGTTVVAPDDPTSTRPSTTTDRVVDDPVRPTTTDRARPTTSSPTRPTASDRPVDRPTTTTRATQPTTTIRTDTTTIEPVRDRSSGTHKARLETDNDAGSARDL